MMRTKYIGYMLCVAMVSLLVNVGMAADGLIKAELNSAYIWRGITINDGLVLQPQVNIGSGGAALNVWGNVDLSDYKGRFKEYEFSEVDLEPSYSVTTSGVTVVVGLREFLYPHQVGQEVSTRANGSADTNVVALAGSREVFGGIRYKAQVGLYMGLDVSYDYDEYRDSYWRLSTGFEGDYESNLTYILDASVGVVGRGMTDGVHDGFHEYELSAKVAYSINKDFAIGARLAFTDTLNEDVLPGQDVNLYGGVSVGYNF